MTTDGTQKKITVLFLCTHNSARSQMAQGLLTLLGGSAFESLSAGTEETHVRPLAIESMNELSYNLSTHSSKTLDQYLDRNDIDFVITVCDNANDTCPVFMGAKKRLHWSFPDPSKATGTKEEQLATYRTVRDAIRKRIEAEILPLVASA
ncbi:protein-tyrosine phosphatase, low molecular weight [Chytridium lagenaria]|nr:protein-tyrosine phosphatase, low molecular weight [Chytridium lagenaria]